MFQIEALLRIRKELKSNNVYVIDLAHAAAYIHPIPEDFSLSDRKAYKVGALLLTLERFCLALNNNRYFGLPANTRLCSLENFYASLEQTTVPTMSLPESVLTDLDIIFSGQIPPSLRDKILFLLSLGIGEKLPQSAKQIKALHKTASETAIDFNDQALKAGCKLESANGAFPHVVELFKEIHQSLEKLKHHRPNHTDLVQKIVK